MAWIKYVVMPGFVCKGRRVEYLDSEKLLKLYGVTEEYITIADISIMSGGYLRKQNYLKRKVLLRPDPTGKYAIPDFCGYRKVEEKDIPAYLIPKRLIMVSISNPDNKFIPLWNITPSERSDYVFEKAMQFMWEVCTLDECLAQLNGTGFGKFRSELTGLDCDI